MFLFVISIGLFAISAAHADMEAPMKDGQLRKIGFPPIKGLVTKPTKFGQRWILTERGSDGRTHSITVPIEPTDSVEVYRQKVEDARKRLAQRQSGTFEEFFARFAATRMLSDATKRLYTYALDGFSFDEAANRTAMTRLLTADCKKSTIAEYVTKVSCFFEWAAKHGSGIENPARDVTIKCTSTARQRIMTDDEIRKVLDYVSKKEPKYRLFVLLLLHTGARVSSVLALRKRDMTEHGLRLYNAKCRRYYDYLIPIRNAEILKAFEDADDEGPILGRDGDRYHRTLNSWLGRHFPRDERGERLSVHSFRHTFASRAAQRDVPLALVSKLLDHQSVATTAKFYARFSHEQIKDAVDKALGDLY